MSSLVSIIFSKYSIFFGSDGLNVRLIFIFGFLNFFILIFIFFSKASSFISSNLFEIEFSSTSKIMTDSGLLISNDLNQMSQTFYAGIKLILPSYGCTDSIMQLILSPMLIEPCLLVKDFISLLKL